MTEKRTSSEVADQLKMYAHFMGLLHSLLAHAPDKHIANYLAEQLGTVEAIIKPIQEEFEFVRAEELSRVVSDASNVIAFPAGKMKGSYDG